MKINKYLIFCLIFCLILFYSNLIYSINIPININKLNYNLIIKDNSENLLFKYKLVKNYLISKLNNFEVNSENYIHILITLL